MSNSSPSDQLKWAQTQRKKYEDALQSFAISSKTFQILYTATKSHSSGESSTKPLKTLYILDSSFNPPTRAHLTLARNALAHDTGPRPARMMLLLATENADKKPKPAPFEDRLVTMSLLAHQLAAESSASSSSDSAHEHTDSDSDADIDVDVAVTKKPFFMDKAASIDESDVYDEDVQQVHLTGFDTIVRIFNPKYYPPDAGLSVLEPFLARHRLRVCYRMGEEDEQRDRAEQERYVEGIGDGSRKEEGMRKEWREKVELVDDAREVKGVSSTQARKAAVEGRREDLEGLLGSEVAAYVVQEGLYRDDEAVKKVGIQPRD